MSDFRDFAVWQCRPMGWGKDPIQTDGSCYPRSTGTYDGVPLTARPTGQWLTGFFTAVRGTLTAAVQHWQKGCFIACTRMTVPARHVPLISSDEAPGDICKP